MEFHLFYFKRDEVIQGGNYDLIESIEMLLCLRRLWNMEKYKLNSSADIWSLAMKRDIVFPLFNSILGPLWKEACLL